MGRPICLRDATLTSGSDAPGVSFSVSDKLGIIRQLQRAGIPEAEIVAPSRVAEDLRFGRRAKAEGLQLRTSGLVHASSPEVEAEMETVASHLDRFDLLMPLSESRSPVGGGRKVWPA